MPLINPKIEDSWKENLQHLFQQNSFQDLKKFLLKEKSKKIIYPPSQLIFSAFDKTPFDQTKVVILGQDPYHGEGQANGLCFSVADGQRQPPSLQNIFKELKADLKVNIPMSGDLSPWARQGILLLNATLTVEKSMAGSHQNQGWENFTDGVIQVLSELKQDLVFLLWGKFAQSKENLIDKQKHLILKAAHPSPFSAYQGFFGAKHFSKTNLFLVEKKRNPIDWNL